MKLTEKRKLLLFRVLKPFQPSDDWTREECLELDEFFLRLCRSLKVDGYDMDHDIKLTQNSIKELKNLQDE